MTDKLDPAEVLRALDLECNSLCRPDRRNAITLIHQMQEAMVEVDRRAAFYVSSSFASYLAHITEPLAPFLPKPDPLRDVFAKLTPIPPQPHSGELPADAMAREVRAELTRRGLKIVEI